MRKLVIPIILSITILVAGVFAFTPIDKATTVHDQIIGAFEDSTDDLEMDIADLDADVADLATDHDDLAAADVADLDADVANLSDQNALLVKLQLIDLNIPLLSFCPFEFIQIVYLGEVTSIDDPMTLLNGNIVNGETIFGNYCYDPDTPDLAGNAQNGFYVMEFHSITIGDDDFTCDVSSELRVFDDAAGRDGFDIQCSNMSPSFSATDGSLYLLQLLDTDQTIFVDDSLPLSLPDLNEFETIIITWTVEENSDDALVIGEISSMIQLP